MDSITKNKKKREDIERMVEHLLPGNAVRNVEELKEGYFNAAYEIVLSDGRTVILKVAPGQTMPIMSYEKNIMYSEITAMELVRRKTTLPVAEVYGYDGECTVCDAPYFVMEKLPGRSLADSGETLSREEKSRIWRQMGDATRQINEITGERFGYPGQPQMQGTDWFQVFEEMIGLAVADADKLDIDLKVETSKLFRGLKRDKDCFREIQTPRLVHWDLWDGNILVQNGQITGFIDFERAIWGDPLMEVGFRSYDQREDFLKGYGKHTFTEYEKKRIFWYDIYLFLLVALEYDYRKYDTDDTYRWATEMLTKYREVIISSK